MKARDAGAIASRVLAVLGWFTSLKMLSGVFLSFDAFQRNRTGMLTMFAASALVFATSWVLWVSSRSFYKPADESEPGPGLSGDSLLRILLAAISVYVLFSRVPTLASILVVGNLPSEYDSLLNTRALVLEHSVASVAAIVLLSVCLSKRRAT